MRDAADEKQGARQTAIDQMLATQRIKDLEAVLSTPQGRRFVWWLIEDLSGMLRNPMTGNARTYFHLGEQNVGRELMGRVQREQPKQFLTMFTEGQAEYMRVLALMEQPPSESNEGENDA